MARYLSRKNLGTPKKEEEREGLLQGQGTPLDGSRGEAKPKLSSEPDKGQPRHNWKNQHKGDACLWHIEKLLSQVRMVQETNEF